jgi:phosphate transport system protein
MDDMTAPHRKHILTQFDAELEGLKSQLLQMGRLVDRQVTEAIEAFTTRDAQRAKHVIEGDREVNQLERLIDERCISMLALRQPEASDLRFLAAVLKIVTDLERIGDLAVSTAEQVDDLDVGRPLLAVEDLPRLVNLSLDMLRCALRAFVDSDVPKAQGVLASDSTVEASMRHLVSELRDVMRREPASVSNGLATISVAKHAERMAAHATNIAEMVVYIDRGEDIRHAR